MGFGLPEGERPEERPAEGEAHARSDACGEVRGETVTPKGVYPAGIGDPCRGDPCCATPALRIRTTCWCTLLYSVAICWCKGCVVRGRACWFEDHAGASRRQPCASQAATLRLQAATLGAHLGDGEGARCNGV